MATGTIKTDNLEVLYSESNAILTRVRHNYVLRFSGCSPANYSTAINNIRSYFPSSLFSVLYSVQNGIYYMATFGTTENSVSCKIIGTYGNVPTDFTSTSHLLYGDIVWEK